MKHVRKQITITGLLAVLAALIPLAAGLSSLEFKPGDRILTGGTGLSETQGVPFSQTLEAAPLVVVQGVFVLTLLVLAIILVYAVMKHVSWKVLLQVLLISAAVVLIGFALPPIAPGETPVPQADGQAVLQPSPEPASMEPGEPPGILCEITAAVLLALAAAGVYFLRRRKPSTLREQLLEEAQAAAGALRSGMNFKNVIVRCYVQMSQILASEQGIEREEHLTPAEFREKLIREGFPEEPVDRLTALFEKVRYSQRGASTIEEQEALDCFEQILLPEEAGG